MRNTPGVNFHSFGIISAFASLFSDGSSHASWKCGDQGDFWAADKIIMFLDLPSIIDWMPWHLRRKCAFLLTQRRLLSNSCQFLVFLAFAVVFDPAVALVVSCRCDASTKHIVVGSGLL